MHRLRGVQHERDADYSDVPEPHVSQSDFPEPDAPEPPAHE